MIKNFFPVLEKIITEKVNWSMPLTEPLKVVCLYILKCLLCCVRIRLPVYFNSDNFQLWMYFLKHINSLPVPDNLMERPASWNGVLELETSADWKIKRYSMQVLARMLHELKMTKKRLQPETMILKEEFLSKYSSAFMEHAIMLVQAGLTRYVSPKTLTQGFKFLALIFQIESVAQNLISQFDILLFDICIPHLGVNQKDQENWANEAATFLYSQTTRVDGHNQVKNAAKGLIDQLIRLDRHLGQSSLQKILAFVEQCFLTQKNPRTQEALNFIFKDCLLSAIVHLTKTSEKSGDSALQTQIENLIERVILKEFATDSDLVKTRICSLIDTYGATFIHSQESINQLCSGLKSSLESKSLVLQINALLALNKAGSNPKVVEIFSNDIQLILQHIVNCMDAVDFKELVCASEGIIKDFHEHMKSFAVHLIQHFNKTFYKYLENSKNPQTTLSDFDSIEEDSEIEQNTIYESIYAAEACLEAILTIMQLDLEPQLRAEANQLVMCMTVDVILQENTELFIRCLSILNFILYKDETVNPLMNYFFPIICYAIVGQKPNGQLIQTDIPLSKEFIQVLVEKDFSDFNDGVFAASLGCLLTFICKLGPQLFTTTDFFGTLFSDLLFSLIKYCLNPPKTEELNQNPMMLYSMHETPMAICSQQTQTSLPSALCYLLIHGLLSSSFVQNFPLNFENILSLLTIKTEGLDSYLAKCVCLMSCCSRTESQHAEQIQEVLQSLIKKVLVSVQIEDSWIVLPKEAFEDSNNALTLSPDFETYYEWMFFKINLLKNLQTYMGCIDVPKLMKSIVQMAISIDTARKEETSQIEASLKMGEDSQMQKVPENEADADDINSDDIDTSEGDESYDLIDEEVTFYDFRLSKLLLMTTFCMSLLSI